eukprot:7253161-Prymnesium_polylepis.2
MALQGGLLPLALGQLTAGPHVGGRWDAVPVELLAEEVVDLDVARRRHEWQERAHDGDVLSPQCQLQQVNVPLELHFLSPLQLVAQDRRLAPRHREQRLLEHVGAIVEERSLDCEGQVGAAVNILVDREEAELLGRVLA